MGSCLTKPPVDIEVHNQSKCPSPCCDNDICTINCCVFTRKSPQTASKTLNVATQTTGTLSVDQTNQQIIITTPVHMTTILERNSPVLKAINVQDPVIVYAL